MLRRSPFLVLALAATAASALSGCLVEQREVVRDDPAPLSSPPPPPADERMQAAEEAPPRDEDAVDEGVFYERLSPYGHWSVVAPYGRVWVPSVAWGWRPYYYGQWVLTDWGWTFVSDDPWGWAAYHYGRWNFGPGVGWYWIPGNVWAPAWVSWRYGGGWVTWAPLGPAGVYWDVYSPAWVVVPEQHFTRPIATVAVSGRAAPHAVAVATPLAGPHANVSRSGQFGPPVARIQSAVGHPVRPVTATSVVRPPAGVRSGPAARPGPSGPGVRPGAPAVRPASPGRPHRDDGRPRGASGFPREDGRGGFGRPAAPGPRYAAPAPAARSGGGGGRSRHR